jgi:hypothetical protein
MPKARLYFRKGRCEMSAHPGLAFKRLGLRERADLADRIARGASFASLVTDAIKSMTPLELADFCLAFEFLRPKPPGMPKCPVLREVLTFDVQRAQGACLLQPSMIYARYVSRCKEYGRDPLSLAWFGRLAKPLMREIHGLEPHRNHSTRGWLDVILVPSRDSPKSKKGAGAQSAPENVPAEAAGVS